MDWEFSDPADEERYWSNRRTWIKHNGMLYFGDPGMHHPDTAKKYGFEYAFGDDPEGDVFGGKARGIDPESTAEAQRHYDKHFRDIDYPPKMAAPMNKFVLLNNDVAFGQYYPQMIYDLAMKQNLKEANQLSNLVAAGMWPTGIPHALAVGLVFPNNLVQIEKSNRDRTAVRDTVTQHLTTP